LAVPPLLGFAALGLDNLMHDINLRVGLEFSRQDEKLSGFSLPVSWVLLPFLILALRNAHEMNSRFLVTTTYSPDLSVVIDQLESAETEWVMVPFGQHFWFVPALERNMKIGFDFARTWSWPERPNPAIFLEASMDETKPGMEVVEMVGDIRIFQNLSGPQYAVVTGQNQTITPCRAKGMWGNIDVTCSLADAGTLIVQEYNWSGWKAFVNEERVPLQDVHWLSVNLPAGESHIEFLYRPWDVFLGLILFVAGIVCSVRVWIRNPEN
jgi:hypothetical protein